MATRTKFPVLVVGMLATSLMFLAFAGAFVYSTGQEVVMTPKMAMVSHTEYAYSAPGQIIARLVDFQGNPVTVTNCTTTILYPDKTKFVDSSAMTASINITGDYFYTFTTPAGPEGTYEYQATCYYAGGNKNSSVTNSFHLTPNFNNVLGNLSYIESQLGAVAGNFTQLSLEIAGVNASLAGQLTDLSTQLNANVSTVLTELSNVNSSLSVQIDGVSTQIMNLNAAMGGNFSDIQANFSQVLVQLGNLSASVNFSEVLDAVASVNSTTQASFGVVTSQLESMNVTLNSNVAYLVLINTTTTNTYDYMTGTLASNVNSVLADLGVINATVNRIETISNQINTTANTILENQQNAIQMSVFSG